MEIDQRRTSNPFVKDRMAEMTLAAMQRIAATTVTKLKHRQVASIGSGLARTLTFGKVVFDELVVANGCEVSTSSISLAIFSGEIFR